MNRKLSFTITEGLAHRCMHRIMELCRYGFTADDLLKRVSAVSEERFAACTTSPVRGAEGVRRTPSPISMKAVRRCLEEVRQFGLWALNHNHQKLAAV